MTIIKNHTNRIQFPSTCKIMCGICLLVFILGIILFLFLVPEVYLYRRILSGHSSYESNNIGFFLNQGTWELVTPYLIRNHAKNVEDGNQSLFRTYSERLHLWNGLLDASLILEDTEIIKKIDGYILQHLQSGKIRKDELDNLMVMTQERNNNTNEWKMIMNIIDPYAANYYIDHEHLDFSSKLLQDEIQIAIQRFLQENKKHLYPSIYEYVLLKNDLYFQKSEFSYQYNQWNILQKKDRIIVKFILSRDNSIELQSNIINGTLEIHFVYLPKEKKFEIIFWNVSPYVK